jgi:hypothetical protein
MFRQGEGMSRGILKALRSFNGCFLGRFAYKEGAEIDVGNKKSVERLLSI